MTSPSGSRCTLVVPCYNEAERLDVAAFERALDRLPGLEFLFVNDGSRDGTLELLTRMRPGREDRITVLDKQQNAGKAEAVRDGLLMALADPGVAASASGMPISPPRSRRFPPSWPCSGAGPRSRWCSGRASSCWGGRCTGARPGTTWGACSPRRPR